jgi:hypothetical protein
MEHDDRSAIAYLDYSGRDDLLSGGVRLIPTVWSVVGRRFSY